MSSGLDPTTLVDKTKESVAVYMKPNDASHDINHISRVLDLALRLLEIDSAERPEIPYNKLKVTLAALVHDVGDHKYPKPGQTPEEEKIAGQTMLIRNGADLQLAQAVQLIASTVSYTRECLYPEELQRVIEEHPELAVVQDADRLDSLGAIGIARIMTYNGAHPAPGGTMESALRTCRDKLGKVPGLMKTAEGKRRAIPRWEFTKAYLEEWNDELDLTGDGSKRVNWEGGIYE